MSIFYVMGFFPKIPSFGEMNFNPSFNPEALHVTLMPVFTVPQSNIADVLLQFQQVSKFFSPIRLEPAGQAVFTDREGQGVVVEKMFDKSGELPALHKELLCVVENNNGIVESPWVGDNFSAHVTGWDDPQTILIKNLSVVQHAGGFGIGVKNLLNFQLQG